MHALIIAAFAVLYLGEELGAPLVPSLEPWAVAWSLAMTGAVVVPLWVYSAAQMRGLNRDGSIRRVRRVERAAGVARWGVLATHAAGVLGFGLLHQIRGSIGDLIAADEVLALCPLILGLVAVEYAIYPVERRLRDAMLIRSLDEGRPVHPYPPRVRFVWLWARHHVLFILIPLAILLAWSESARYFVPASISDPTARDGLYALVQIVGVGVVFALIPPLLVNIWDTVPLAPSALRTRLEAMCVTHRVRVRGILVWRTGGLILNAAAIGLLRPLRYIVLTDALLEQLSDREAEAVAAHEIGHIRYHHTLWLALSVLAAVLAAGTLTGWAMVLVSRLTPIPPESFADRFALTTALVATLGFTLVVLGMVSRRFERQADAFALRHLSGETDRKKPVEVTTDSALAMAGALERVAEAHAIDTRRRTFRHGSIWGRQKAITGSIGRMTNKIPQDRVARRVRLAIIALLALGIVLAALDVMLNT